MSIVVLLLIIATFPIWFPVLAIFCGLVYVIFKGMTEKPVIKPIAEKQPDFIYANWNIGKIAESTPGTEAYDKKYMGL